MRLLIIRKHRLLDIISYVILEDSSRYSISADIEGEKRHKMNIQERDSDAMMFFFLFRNDGCSSY